jgi:hypothetical protein
VPRAAGREATKATTSGIISTYRVHCTSRVRDQPYAYNSRLSSIQPKEGGMTNESKGENVNNEKPAVTLPGVVEKIVKPIVPSEPEKAQIAIQGADDLYREIRVENTLENAAGEKVRLKPGAEVDVTIEAPAESVEKKPA